MGTLAAIAALALSAIGIGVLWGLADLCQAGKGYCGGSAAIEWVRELLEDWEAAIVALGTLAIAWFTLTLSQATKKLWKVSVQQASDTNRSLQITQRACIAVAALGVEPFGMESVANLSIWNVGRLPAKHVSWFIDWSIDANGMRSEFPIGEPFYGNNVIPPGTEMRRSQNLEIPEQVLGRFHHPPRIYLYVWGEVRYSDGFDNPRFTRFCHRYDHRGIRKITKGLYTGHAMISADSMRYHQFGNDAD